MAPPFADTRRWTAEGTTLLCAEVAGLGEDAFDAPSLLPGWTRKHVVAHVAANADAIANLVRWAATGVETPMYRSADERAAGIARGASLPTPELVSWLRASSDALDTAMQELSETQWAREVRTAQGRVVPATETPWMRAREVYVHAVDLDTGVTFADLPAEFDAALCDDIRNKRGLLELPAEVAGAPLPELTAWLAGRRHAIAGAPALGAWL